MKIRRGFVSNSSTTSFCVYGICLGDIGGWEEAEKLYGEFVETGLEVHTTPWDYTYVGRDWSSIKNDETGAQFKENVKEVLKEKGLLGDNKLGTFEEAWRDG